MLYMIFSTCLCRIFEVPYHNKVQQIRKCWLNAFRFQLKFHLILTSIHTNSQTIFTVISHFTSHIISFGSCVFTCMQVIWFRIFSIFSVLLSLSRCWVCAVHTDTLLVECSSTILTSVFLDVKLQSYFVKCG